MFTKVISVITKGMDNVKKVAAIVACIQASLTAWHTEWAKHFPDVTASEVVKNAIEDGK